MGWFEILLVTDHFFSCTLLFFNCVYARKFLFIQRLLGFFNEGESFLDECSADCAISNDTDCLPDHQYCLPLLQNPKSHSQFSHYFIVIVLRKTLAVLLKLCYEFQAVAQTMLPLFLRGG